MSAETERKGKVIPCIGTEDRKGAGTNSGELYEQHYPFLILHTRFRCVKYFRVSKQ